MIKLSEIPTRAPKGLKKDDTKNKLDVVAREIARLQEILFAGRKHSLLVILQGMDASGKNGATREVFRYSSPTGVRVYGFKKPTPEEFAHDFLWRVHKQTPAKGMIQVFQRSHYEDILIQRVHKWIDDKEVDKRIKAINDFEHLLIHNNNTTILKFYLHISRERQKEKLIERTKEKDKFWKHNPDDLKESEHWDEYMRCYEDAINRSDIPWIIAPVDQRWYRNYFIASRVLDTLKALNLKFPGLPKE